MIRGLINWHVFVNSASMFVKPVLHIKCFMACVTLPAFRIVVNRNVVKTQFSGTKRNLVA